MKWKRTGQYTLESGAWVIAKCFVGDGVVYVLTNNSKWIGNYETAEEAQSAARECKG